MTTGFFFPLIDQGLNTLKRRGFAPRMIELSRDDHAALLHDMDLPPLSTVVQSYGGVPLVVVALPSAVVGSAPKRDPLLTRYRLPLRDLKRT